MLLVPLGLSVPGLAPGAGEEVVLAAGPPPGTGSEDTDLVVETSLELELAAEDLDGPVDEASAAAQLTGSSPSTKPSSGSKASPSKKRSTTASTPKRKSPASTAGTASKAAPTTHAVALRVAVAAAPQAPPPAPTPPPTTAAPAAPAPAPAPSSADSTWDRLAVCESGNTNDGGAPYYGYWQFSAGTWSSMGEPGLPNDHSRAHQLAVAKRLQARSGWGQWPSCSRKLGLR